MHMRRVVALSLVLTIALGVFVSGCAQQPQAPVTPAETPSETEGAVGEEGTPTEAPAVPVEEAQTAPVVEVQIVNYAFIPSTITVKAGTTVQWVNNDNVKHTVTSDEGVFDSGVFNTGDIFEYTFDTPGEYSYHCELHPFMKGKVIVEE
ncbi:MAG: hypothetical protein PWR26_928 [Methanosarcinales archaeon]|nr:cupredoxin family copper-binding protein [Methermicoccus shengliensis]KUK04319.1 MAG: Copper binding protein, plastocyanin/azurin family [Euryarchaeota archaeon 55_53]KUK30662.1 MAG: Copper binding protein, plastocyanin/azurin family [Methanosarcinales archeaon 56_1174]MDI3488211.1 hypothetical protein [Methanosarcinales archaeon]MDN5295486.1 hypothetical protein [Methanosarcinales archaeon]